MSVPRRHWPLGAAAESDARSANLSGRMINGLANTHYRGLQVADFALLRASRRVFSAYTSPPTTSLMVGGAVSMPKRAALQTFGFTDPNPYNSTLRETYRNGYAK